MTTVPPRIWVLLGSRIGDNNQLLALAETLGLPFETRTMRYRRLWPLHLRLFPRRPTLLERGSRATLQPPWPDLVIGIGRRSVAVARWIERRSGGKTRVVRLGNPRADPALFDLVITTPQYPVPSASNVLVLPLSISRHRSTAVSEAEARWLEELPRPHLLLSLGGATRFWQLSNERLAGAAAVLADRAAAAGGSLLIVGSPRTTADAFDAVRRAARGQNHCHVLKSSPVRYGVLVADADEHFVTADSVSMISEAILTGKPVGIVPVELDDQGRKKLGRSSFSSRFRDLRRFWKSLDERGLSGTVEQPVRGKVEDPAEIAAIAVQRLLSDRVE